MTQEEIQDLIKFVAKSGVHEVEIERKDFKITIKSDGNKRGKGAANQEVPQHVQVIPQAMPMQMQMPAPVAAPVAAPAPALFGEDTPLDLIAALQPDVLVKGGDYDATCTDQENPRYIVGSAEVRARGGKVETIALVPGRSTTAIADRLKG